MLSDVNSTATSKLLQQPGRTDTCTCMCKLALPCYHQFVQQGQHCIHKTPLHVAPVAPYCWPKQRAAHLPFAGRILLHSSATKGDHTGVLLASHPVLSAGQGMEQLTFMSWAAFCLLAVPRKATTMVSCPQATRHLVLVKGSLISSKCSRLYSSMAVSSEDAKRALPCIQQCETRCGH